MEQLTPMIIGFFVVLVGFSFAYKFFRSFILGKLDYWSGFLPITIISPLFIVGAAPTPESGKRSLIKETSGLWVHLVMGPFFLIASTLLIAAGCDLMGLPGTDSLNYVLNGGNPLSPMAITYDKKFTIQFPFLVRAMKKFGRGVNGAQIPLPAEQRMVDSPEIRAEEARRQQEAQREY